MRFSNLHIFLVLSNLSLLLFSCDRAEKHPLPGVPVNFIINVYNDAEFIKLRAIGNSQEIKAYMLGYATLGYDNNGVIVYNNSGDEYYAFDMTCPFDLPNSVAVELDGSSVAICPQCGTHYILPSNGYPSTEGPGKWPLKQYRAFFNPNTGDVQVSN